jgi:hypothetical protein
VIAQWISETKQAGFKVKTDQGSSKGIIQP